ncbi:DUF3429 domain-containing protein [Chitinimonas sp. BJB300]|uniref:DUF3429 domain-containing protein n=1 Tax=Chitinimonas sp. BJB300 TaxID=1559339 RepID=UPI00130407B2|nr:DUF3429 domain-containing protein [Chitinimonas sp. BJB300]
MSTPSETRTPIPTSARWLGVAGLVPFYACLAIAALDLAHHRMVPLNALVIYGAIILTFTGAIWWGLAVHAPSGTPVHRVYTVSTLAALVGWVALLLPTNRGLALLMAGFMAQSLADYALYFSHPRVFPGWLMHLRRLLTVGVVIALVIGSALLPR